MLLNVFLNWIAGWYQLRFGSNSFKESCQAGTGNQSTFAGLTGCLKQDKISWILSVLIRNKARPAQSCKIWCLWPLTLFDQPVFSYFVIDHYFMKQDSHWTKCPSKNFQTQGYFFDGHYFDGCFLTTKSSRHRLTSKSKHC